MAVVDALLEILRCPKCRSRLLDREDFLICENGDCRLQYPVRQEIPVLLINEAEELSPEAWQSFNQK